LPALHAGYVTFGSPNSFKKVTAAALELWATVLAAVPGSRMLIVAPAGVAWDRVERAFAAHGVEPARLERLPHAPRAQYLSAMQRMDCVLDTTPYNGGTASFDALHLGVPVVTLRGDSAAARSGASILQHLGLPQLVATNWEEYVSAARALAGDWERLRQLRAGLRERMLSSVLMDPRAFTRGLEGLYFQMLEAWLAAEVETKTS
jgi:predicted O-linked N-acetylglucosamine transferase (SPINDLY family)